MPGIEVVRWGRSAYETDEALAGERENAVGLGLGWRLHVDRVVPPQGLGPRTPLVVTSKVRVDASVARALAGGLVITTTSGFDHIDLAACAAHGVAVARCPLARRDAVVEHTLACTLHLLRGLGVQQQAATEGRWVRGDLPALRPRSLAGAVVVVVGVGVIGREVVTLFQQLGAAVRCVDPHAALPWPVWPLHEALRGADALTLHCALTPGSRGLIGAAQLDLLPDSAIVVNTARGDSLDVVEAVRRVEAGALGGLAVDVFPKEPWPSMAAARDPRIVFTPHGAGYTEGLAGRVAAEVKAALKAWLDGRPLPHPVRLSTAV
jgi:glycerate dehydrogenase